MSSTRFDDNGGLVFGLSSGQSAVLYFSNVGTDENNNPVSCRLTVTGNTNVNSWNTDKVGSGYDMYGVGRHFLVVPDCLIGGTNDIWWLGGVAASTWTLEFYRTSYLTASNVGSASKITPLRFVFAKDSCENDAGGFEWVAFGSSFTADRWVPNASDSRMGTLSPNFNGMRRWTSDTQIGVHGCEVITVANASNGAATFYLGDTVGYDGWTFDFEAPSWAFDVNATIDGVKQANLVGGGTMSGYVGATTVSAGSTDFAGYFGAKTLYSLTAVANDGKHLTNGPTFSGRILYNVEIIYNFVTNKFDKLNYHTNNPPAIYKGQSGKSPVTAQGTSRATDTVFQADTIRYDNTTYKALVPSSNVSSKGWTVQTMWKDSNGSHSVAGGRQGATNIASDLGILDQFKKNDVTAHIYAQWTRNMGGVKVTKRDIQGDGSAQGDATLAGARFNIINRGAAAVTVNGTSYAVGQVCCTITTDAFGNASTAANTLPSGTYEIREATPPVGYLINSSWGGEFEIVDNGVIVDANSLFGICKNNVIRCGIDVALLDSGTHRHAPEGDAILKDAKITIRSVSAHHTIVNGTDYATGNDVVTLTTDGEGKCATEARALPYGTYEVRITCTPDGYRDNDEVYKLVVRQDGLYYSAWYDMDVKRGGLATSLTDLDTGLDVPEGDASFKDAVLKVQNVSQNDVVVDGKVYTSPQVVGQLKTDANGRASWPNVKLPYGTYDVWVETPSEGYKPNKEKKRVTIREDGQVATASFPLDVMRGKGTVIVVDSETGERIPQGDARLSGAVIALKNDSARAIKVGSSTYAKGADVVSMTTDATGYAETAGDLLPYGTYVAHMTTAPSPGYHISTQTGTDKIRYQDGVMESRLAVQVVRGGIWSLLSDADTGWDHPEGDAVFKNAYIRIKNVSDEGVMVNDWMRSVGSDCITIVTDAEGRATTNATELPYGTYEVYMRTSPDGYLPTDKVLTVSVREEGTSVSTEFPVNVIRGGAKINKVDGDGAGFPQGAGDFSGMEVAIQVLTDEPVSVQGPDGEWHVYHNGDVIPASVSGLVTDANGTIHTDTSFLPYSKGTYILYETKAPQGYALSDAKYRISVTEDGVFAEWLKL